MIRPTVFARGTAVCILTASLTGCFNMSGLSGSTDSFSCKAPEGIACASVSGTYANAHAAPSQAAVATPAPSETRNRATLSSGDAIRSQPRVLRIWVAPWEDSDGDLHDQSMLYLTVDAGRWRIEHNRSRIRKEFSPTPPVPSQPPIAMEKSVVQPEMSAAPPAAPTPQPDASPIATPTDAQEQGTPGHAE